MHFSFIAWKRALSRGFLCINKHFFVPLLIHLLQNSVRVIGNSQLRDGKRQKPWGAQRFAVFFVRVLNNKETIVDSWIAKRPQKWSMSLIEDPSQWPEVFVDVMHFSEKRFVCWKPRKDITIATRRTQTLHLLQNDVFRFLWFSSLPGLFSLFERSHGLNIISK